MKQKMAHCLTSPERRKKLADVVTVLGMTSMSKQVGVYGARDTNISLVINAISQLTLKPVDSDTLAEYLLVHIGLIAEDVERFMYDKDSYPLVAIRSLIDMYREVVIDSSAVDPHNVATRKVFGRIKRFPYAYELLTDKIREISRR